jgi:uncharacterized protein (TIGR03083 family)
MADDYESMLLAAYALADADPANRENLADLAVINGMLSIERDWITGVLADAPDAPHPDALDAPPLDAMLAAAKATRHPVPALPPFAAPFGAAAGILDTVLTSVDPACLERPSPVLDWTAGDLVTHLAAGNAQLAAACGVSTDLPVIPDAELETVTRAALAATRGFDPAARRRQWWDGVDTLAAALLGQPELAGRVVDVVGVRMSVASHVVARAFETWNHARDIALVGGLRLPNPTGEVLGPMANLAARALDGLPAPRPGRSGRSGTVRLTLSGPGGRSWLVGIGEPTRPVGSGSRDGPGTDSGADVEARVDAELNADVVAFCLLVADRLAPADLGAVITGDIALAEDLLALAPTLSGP